MNTIKIYLDASGAVASLQKDFPLYQFQYNNKLVNIYVPTSICAGPFIDDNVTIGYVCTMSMKATDWNGISKQTGAYALRYLKTLTQNGVEYALFERALPYAFTIWAGQDQAAPEITISVLNIASGQLLSIINSQNVSIDIMESNDAFDIDYTDIEPTAAQELQAQIDTLTADLALKLNADTTNDNNKVNPNGDNHVVVDNINALIEATQDLPNLEAQVDQNTADIADLKTLSIYGWNVVGTHEIVSQSAQDDNAIPSDADLISWIEALKGSTIEKGDAIFIYWDNYASADDVSLFWYAGTLSNGSYFRQVPYMIHMAGNSVAGLIEGTYSATLTGNADKLMVDIVNGQVTNIYKVKHDESGLVSLKDVIDQAYSKLIANTAAVEMAVKDANGNIITSTYMTISAGATKQYVQDYASPKALYDLNYPDYATDEFKNVNVNDNSYAKTTNSTSIGYTPLSVIGKNLEADILLGNQNGLVNRVWISSNNTESIKLRITTAYADANNVAQTLSTTETETFLVVAGIPVLKQIESVFSSLSTPITLPAGTPLSQTIEVWRENSVSADFTLLCNETYDAYMTLNKIGYVRYALEQEPSAIECGHDSSPTIDSDGDLQVASDGQIHYANGDSAPLTTILKIPMGAITNNDIRPVKGEDVYDAFANREVDVTSWLNTTLTADQEALITTAPLPNLKVAVGGDNYVYSPTYVSSASIGWAYYNGPASTGFVVLNLSTHTLSRTGMNLYHNIGIATDYAPKYSSSSTYAVGDLVMQEGILYQCNTAITTPESFTNAHWTRTDVETLLKAKQDKVAVDTTSTSPITLANNTSFRLGTISSLTISAPSEYSLDFECEVIFTAGTGISMTYSAVSPTWSGDDVSGGVFTPIDGKTYNILFFNNATAVATPSIQAIVRGV